MSIKRISAFLLAASVALAACDDGPTDSNDLDFGTWEGEVSGEFNRDMGGTALSFGPAQFGQDEILLTTTSGNALIYLYHADDYFNEGNTSILDASTNDETGILALIVFENEDRAFLGTSGVLDLDVVDDDGVSGTVSFDAREAIIYNDGSYDLLNDVVSVDATFQAEYAGSSASNRAPKAAARLQRAPK